MRYAAMPLHTVEPGWALAVWADGRCEHVELPTADPIGFIHVMRELAGNKKPKFFVLHKDDYTAYFESV